MYQSKANDFNNKRSIWFKFTVSASREDRGDLSLPPQFQKLVPRVFQKLAKSSKKNGIKLVGYTFRRVTTNLLNTNVHGMQLIFLCIYFFVFLFVVLLAPFLPLNVIGMGQSYNFALHGIVSVVLHNCIL